MVNLPQRHGGTEVCKDNGFCSTIYRVSYIDGVALYIHSVSPYCDAYRLVVEIGVIYLKIE